MAVLAPSARAARARADDVLRVSLARADSIVTATDRRGTVAARELVSDLRAADAELRRRLARYAGSEERFTAASMVSYQRQIELVTRRAERALAAHVGTTTSAAAEVSVEETGRLLARLDEAFTGISRPLRIRQAGAMSGALRRAETSMLRSSATSVSRYGSAMIGEFERRMRVGLIAGLSQSDMVADLVSHGGPRGTVLMEAGPRRTRTEDIPEGLFVRYRSWAWRVVRTETARAYSVARMESLFEQRTEMPALRKKILATFDARTAMDSVLVHGQVRALEEMFVDGVGRTYLQPPARPYDREVVIPWMPDWTETPITTPATPEMISRARAGEGMEVDRAHRLAAARARSADERTRGLRPVPAPGVRMAPLRPAAPPVAPAPRPRRVRPPEPTEGEVPGSQPWYRYATAAMERIAGPALDLAGARRTILRGLDAVRARRDIHGPKHNTDVGADVRRGVRGWLRTHGILSRDVMRELMGASQNVWFEGPARRLGYAAVHGWGGGTRLSDETSNGLLGDSTRSALAGAGRFYAHVTGDLSTIIHEELHASSSMMPEAYRGAGRVIEEVAVELNARRFAAALAGEARPAAIGAYDDYIERARICVPRSYVVRTTTEADIGRYDAHDRALTETWVAMLQRGPRHIGSPEEYVAAMAAHLPGATPEERAVFRERLATLTP